MMGTKSKDNDLKKYAAIAAVGITGGATSVAVVLGEIYLVGFTSSGIAVGSAAASMMSAAAIAKWRWSSCWHYSSNSSKYWGSRIGLCRDSYFCYRSCCIQHHLRFN